MIWNCLSGENKFVLRGSNAIIIIIFFFSNDGGNDKSTFEKLKCLFSLIE